MDGRMNDKPEPQRKPRTQEYPCIWGYGNCPIRKQYKLKPESLNLYCIICPLRIVDVENKLLKMRKEA